MNLKKQLLAINSVKDARELAEDLLKLHPRDGRGDVVEETTLMLLVQILVQSASEQGDNCVQFFLDRLKESDPRDWLPLCCGDARSELEGFIEMAAENYRKMLASQLYERLGLYAREESLR